MKFTMTNIWVGDISLGSSDGTCYFDHPMNVLSKGQDFVYNKLSEQSDERNTDSVGLSDNMAFGLCTHRLSGCTPLETVHLRTFLHTLPI